LKLSQAFCLVVLSSVVGIGAAAQRSTTCATPPAGEQKPWLNPAYTPECRAQFVLAQLHTLDDKFAFLSSSRLRPGSKDRDVWGELGLKHGGTSDGPAGVRANETATAFPTPLSIAASFDVAIATKYGDLEGQEFFDAGISVDYGPAMDIARTWHFGRVTESFGEDPFLAGSIVAPEIRAIQANHIAATMKHFAAYNQEQNRSGDQPTGVGHGVNQIISERALREIYLPAFKAAVQKGGVAKVMCSFPLINGSYACENPYTLGVLNNEWGFKGMVGPDFPDAQRSIVPAFKAGLDSGIMVPPDANTPASADGIVANQELIGTESLRHAVDSGEIPESRIDDMILRFLVIPFQLGMFDHPVQKVSGEVSTPERRAATVPLITAGAVLLKNDGGVLPFGPQIKSVAIIGMQATDKATVVEQGSPWVKPSHVTPILAAVQQRAGSAVQVTFAPGTNGLQPLPEVSTSYLKTPSGEPGVQAEYFANPNRDFSGKPLAVRTEPTLLLTKLPVIEGLPGNLQWSVRYTTMFTPDQTGTQHFTLRGSGEGRLFIGGKLQGEYLRTDFQDIVYANVAMTAGKPVEIRVEYTPRESFGTKVVVQWGINFGLNIGLGWAAPDNKIAEAVEAARKADVAVVFVGHQLGEGMDRIYLGLPNDQDQLIEAVAAVNKHTVVVLNTGGAVLMPWLGKVSAVLETWLPGDSIGPATAKLLFGDAEPGGRLPVTFPADETQGPATKPSDYPGELAADGALGTEHFDEGIFVGYRYWDQNNQKPLFPFGYGLSYTTFKLSDEAVKPTPDGGADVAVKVTNTGKRQGSDVVEVYVEFPASAGEPPRQLKGFAKLDLAPGEQKTAHVTLDKDAFQFWDDATHSWKTASGSYQVIVGASSRDTAWQAAFTPGR